MAKTTTSKAVQTTSQNKEILYRFLHQNGPASRQAIMLGTGLSLPTITQGLNHLAASGLVDVADSIRNTGGRNAVSYACLPQGRYAVGQFFSVHHITTVSVDMFGQIITLRRERCEADLHNEAYLRHLGDSVSETIRETGLPEEALLGVGIAVQSLVSADGETIEHGMTQDFSGVTRRALAAYMPCPTRIFHDASAAGYAEVWSRPDLNHAFYLSLNNVVGGAFIINSRNLFEGDNYRAGEVGHMIVDPDHGEICYCGQRGCFDTLCRSSVLDSYTHGDLNEFFRLLEAGDPEAGARFDVYLGHLATAIHNLRMLLDCPIIIGGYVGSLMEKHMPELYRHIDGLMNFGSPASAFVFPCRYRREATAAGAAIQLIEEFIHSL